jgi:transketolase
MEGISHEACSLAGTLGLGKLIAFYDDNGISIDGHVEGWFTDDTPKRFEAYGWQVIPTSTATTATPSTRRCSPRAPNASKPTLICCKTPSAGFAEQGGHARRARRAARRRRNRRHARRTRLEPRPLRDSRRRARRVGRPPRGAASRATGTAASPPISAAFPELAAEFKRRMRGELPADWPRSPPPPGRDRRQGREHRHAQGFAECIGAFAPLLPELIGGSADLAGSNLTLWKGSKGVSRSDGRRRQLPLLRRARVRHDGDHANGLALHGGLIPYTATFLVFSDYARNAIRMAALMKLRQIMVYTHDSIGLGEDGPTHQPVEQTASLRLIPNVDVWRPATPAKLPSPGPRHRAQDGPTMLALSRQNLPTITAGIATDTIRRGGLCAGRLRRCRRPC